GPPRAHVRLAPGRDARLDPVHGAVAAEEHDVDRDEHPHGPDAELLLLAVRDREQEARARRHARPPPEAPLLLGEGLADLDVEDHRAAGGRQHDRGSIHQSHSSLPAWRSASSAMAILWGTVSVDQIPRVLSPTWVRQLWT